MKYHCRECDSKFDSVIVQLESAVKGELIRIKNDVENPCCPHCMKNALTDVVQAILSLQ